MISGVFADFFSCNILKFGGGHLRFLFRSFLFLDPSIARISIDRKIFFYSSFG
uniref:Uncharacterized protein n=1 Tax=Siphoviridae sp. ctZHD14 TaxID=2827891 RepID=A0A8S5SW06_9CAUD|nr:MAG TPA: hypothetical protein [Siphoviridae sp. ctZHD14]